MLKTLLNKVFGDRHEREARKLLPLVADINEVAKRLRELSDEELKAQTEKFRARSGSARRTWRSGSRSCGRSGAPRRTRRSGRRSRRSCGGWRTG
jgi:hypothetical protein